MMVSPAHTIRKAMSDISGIGSPTEASAGDDGGSGGGGGGGGGGASLTVKPRPGPNKSRVVSGGGLQLQTHDRAQRESSSGVALAAANRNRARTESGGSNIPLLQSSPSNDGPSNDGDDGSYLGDEAGDGEDEFRSGVVLGDGLKYDLCGSMWKRRGGLGRNAERNWVMRCFTLYGPILCYHDVPDLDSVADPSRPRARLNLAKAETIAEMHSKRKPGLPSEHLLTINIYDPIVHSKRKWEMCCTSREQQKVWYDAINAWNGKGEGSAVEITAQKVGDAFLTVGAAVGIGAGPDHDGEDGGVGGGGSTRLSPSHKEGRHSLPDLGKYHAEAKARPQQQRAAPVDDELVAKAAARAVELLREKLSEGRPKFPVAVLSVVVLNAAIHFVRNGSEETYKATMFFANAFALYVFLKQRSPEAGSRPRRGPKARAAKEGRSVVAPKPAGADERARSPRTAPAAAEGVSSRRSFARTLPAGSTIPRASPARDSALEDALRAHGPESATAVRARAAASTDDVEAKPHTYANTDAGTFNLRVGPNYKKNKRKAPSGPALYDLVSLDFLYADAPLKNATDKFRVPDIPGITDVSTGHAHIPPVLIVNTWLPGEEPAMFAKGGGEGETYSIPMVFALSEDTLKQLKDLDSASPGVKLLSEWCKRAEKEPDFRGRFKCMGMIEDIESTGVPKFIQGYNGKPALVTKSGTFRRYANYIEFTINVNMWAFLARKGLYTITPTFPDFVFNVGFTIEGRKDEELPEVLLGGCRLMNLDPEQAVVDGVDDVEL